MKHNSIRIAALLLALLLLLGALTSCASHGQTMITVGDHEISLNVYMLYLSRMKGSLALAGESVNSKAFWQSYISTDNTTMEDYYNAQVLAGLKQIAAALMLYDELELKLDKSVEREIDAWLDALVEEVADGSKSQMNALLSAYGANLTVLRDAAIIEEKVAQLKEHLYGENGALLTAMAKEEFYRATYYRGRVLFIDAYYDDHDRDADGNAIYYEKDGKTIAYDKVNGVPDGTTDKNGDPVHRVPNEDGTLGGIAYDTENGTIKYYVDKDGNREKAYYTEEEMEQKYKALEEIAKTCKGNVDLFLDYVDAFSTQQEMLEKIFPNGMYFSAGSYYSESSLLTTFATELAKLEIGELVILETADGYCLLMREDIDNEAWTKTENAHWFENLSALCVEYMLQQRTEKYLPDVKIDEELAGSASIVDVAANNYY